jgi:AsmA protein
MSKSLRKSVVILGSVLLVLVIAGFIGLSVLDSVLLREARAQATTFGQRIGRPITIERVSTKIVFGPSVRVSGVQIGPASGEELPLMELSRVEVTPKLLRAITSRGKQLEVRSLEIDGLTLNVIRFPDGTTNIERLQSQLVQDQQPETKKPEPLNLQLDHFAFAEGKVRFVEQTKEKPRTAGSADTLQVRHIEVKADNLRAGKALDVSVKAAILAEQRNFQLEMATSPLPPSLIPTPKHLVLKIQPIDLKPIAPYLPRGIGLQDGRLSADLTADLGALVPNGKGATRLRGALSALGLRFAGAEGGKPLDASFDADVQGDMSKGDLQIDRLKIEAGPAGITGKGRVLGLTSGLLRVEGLELVAHDLDPARLAALCPPLQRQLKGQIAGPIGLAIKGSGTEASQAIEVQLDLTPVRLAIPEVLSKASGKTMTLLAHLRGAAAGTLLFDVQADLSGADLRPGESLDKPPGEPLALSISGTKSGDGGKSAPLKVQLSEATAHIRDSTVTGSGWVELSESGKDSKKQFELALQSPRLDLDKLLMTSTSKKEKPPLDPALFTGVRGHATAKIDSLRKSTLNLSNVVADVKMVEDEVTLTTLSMGAFGGKVSANGTTVRLAQRKMPFHVVVQAQNVEVSQALTFVGERKLLAGTLESDLNFSGAGTDKADLIRSLSGAIEGHLHDGKLLGKDLIASVWSPLTKVLPPGLARPKPDAGFTSLGKDVGFAISVEKGFAKLKAPLQINLPEGQLSMTGGAHLDGNLDLAGTVALAPSTVAALTGGKVAPSGPIPINLKIVGPASSPNVAVADPAGIAASLAKQAATSAIGHFLGTGTGGAGDAQNKAAEEQQGVKDRAGKEAEKAGKQAEEKAKQFLKGLPGR